MKTKIILALRKISTEYKQEVYDGNKPGYAVMIEKGLRYIEDSFFDGLIPDAPSREIVRLIVEKVESETIDHAEIDYMADEIERLINA